MTAAQSQNLNLSGRAKYRRLGQMKTYGQYCPIARTSELLSERWTPILIRNLLAGCRTFSQLLAGAPGMSRALLAQRLALLERAGIVMAERGAPGGRVRAYELTPKGRELKAVTDAMGAWGARWLELEADHVEPGYVLWATARLVDLGRLPRRGLVVRFDLADRPADHFWMLLRPPSPEVCSSHPGGTEDLVVETDAETLARWHLRHVTYADAVADGRLRIEGSDRERRQFLRALRPSPFARSSPAEPQKDLDATH